jgi:hypothetical protein
VYQDSWDDTSHGKRNYQAEGSDAFQEVISEPKGTWKEFQKFHISFKRRLVVESVIYRNNVELLFVLKSILFYQL